MWKVHLRYLDNPTRLPGEEGNPLPSPDVSSNRLRGGLYTTLQVTSKDPFRYHPELRILSYSRGLIYDETKINTNPPVLWIQKDLYNTQILATFRISDLKPDPQVQR